MLIQPSEFSSKNNEMNQLKYISTYKMGQIGITKLIEEPYKPLLNTENNILSQSEQIIQIPINTNCNTNNTNSNNTNSNTNTNTFKAIDNISNQKKIKKNNLASHNAIQTPSSSNINYYKTRKNKSNQKINIININKKDKKQKFEAIKLNKNQFSKTTNNLCLYMNSNITNKNQIKNKYKNSYTNNQNNTKTNSKNQTESGYSKYILSSRAPSSIKRNQKKNSISHKNSNSQSSTNIIKTKKLANDNINSDIKYQLTEFNTYLKVRKRTDISCKKQSNSKLREEDNQLLSSCIINHEKNGYDFSDKKDDNYFSEILSTEDNIKGKPNIKLILIDNKNINRLFTENNTSKNSKNTNIDINIFNKNNSNNNKNISTSKTNLIDNKRKNSSYKDLNKINFCSKTYSQSKNKINYNKPNLNDKNLVENINKKLNNFDKKINNINKNKNSFKARKNFSVNTSKKQIIKEANNKDKDKKVNLRYNSFVKAYNNDKNNNNINKEKNEIKIEKNVEVNLNKEIQFESPEEVHFFMVKLTHNCIYANSKF